MDRSRYEEYLIKFNARDYEGVLGYYADDFEIVFAGYRLRGREAMLRFYGFFHRYVRESISLQAYVADANMVAIEARVRLEFVEDLTPEALRQAGFDRLVGLPKGAVVELPQFIHYHVEGGKFTRALCAVLEGVAE
ncbi:MAG TPA: nuclear transport factor 2 family protein [Ramlibacter sp.]|nr:nuclear transport factor 2 family protein [Ramlibacter sp.]